MTRDDISKLAIDAGVSIRGHYDETGSTPAELQRFAELVAAAEREECAKVCDDYAVINGTYTKGATHIPGKSLAGPIRRRKASALALSILQTQSAP